MLTQHQVAGMTDDQIRGMAMGALAHARDDTPYAPVWRELAAQLARVRRERRSTWLWMVAELEDDDEAIGSLVEPGDDPVGDALRELRGEGGGVV